MADSIDLRNCKRNSTVRLTAGSRVYIIQFFKPVLGDDGWITGVRVGGGMGDMAKDMQHSIDHAVKADVLRVNGHVSFKFKDKDDTWHVWDIHQPIREISVNGVRLDGVYRGYHTAPATAFS